jgi:hypothetical protein
MGEKQNQPFQLSFNTSLKVEFHAAELFSRVGFIETNLETDSRAVVRFYNKRGTPEQWIKEGKQAVKTTRLSYHRFRLNEVRLWLTVIAYNLGNLWRRLALPLRVGNWSPTSLQRRRGFRVSEALGCARGGPIRPCRDSAPPKKSCDV